MRMLRFKVCAPEPAIAQKGEVLVRGVNFCFFTTFRKSFAMRVYSSKGNLRTKRKITSDSPRCEKVARLLPALTSLKTPKILWHPSRWHPIQPHPVRGLLPIGGQLSDYWTFKSFEKWMGNDKKNRDQNPKSLIRANVNGKIRSAKSAQNAQTPLKVNAKFQKVHRKFSQVKTSEIDFYVGF